MSNFRFATFAVTIALMTLTAPVQCQDLAKQKQALDLIKEFAASLCDSVKAQGKSEAWEASGEAKAKLGGVIKKITARG